MELVQIKDPAIDFRPNKKLEVTKNAMLLTYVVLETLYKTIFGKYLAVEMERLQCAVGAVLACLLLVEWFRLDKDKKIKWIKRHAVVFIYFAIRVVTFVSIGFQYTMLRSVFFEGIYLFVLTELVVDSKLCKTTILKFFIIFNVIINLVNTYIYIHSELVYLYADRASDMLYRFAMQYTYLSAENKIHFCSMYSNPNQMGLMTGLAMLIALNYISKDMKFKDKVFGITYYIFSFCCLLYSNCSSSHIAFLTAIIALTLIKRFGLFSNKKIICICLSCCILCTCGIYAMVAFNNEYSNSEFEAQFNAMSTSRYVIWKDSYYSHQDEALLGCGNMTLEKRDRYQYNLDKGIDKGLDINGSLIDYVGPHNGYIGTISCAGLLGFAAFIALLLKKINDSKSLNQGYWYLAIIFILVINLFECMMPISKNFVTLYMFLILTMDDREETT